MDAGSPAPDFEACDTRGKVVRLSDYWRDSALVVVFLRYLGCPFCREQVIALRDNYESLQEAGAQVVCVAMGGDKVGLAFQTMFALPYPMLMLDESDTRPYRQYGLMRQSLLQVLRPQLSRKGLAMLFSLGKRFGDLSHPGDKQQMPGTFIIDTGGTIQLAYRSRDAVDNAPVALLLKTLEQMRGAAV